MATDITSDASLDLLNGWVLCGLDYPSFRMSLVAKVMDRLTIRELADCTDLKIAEWRVLSRLSQSAEGLTVRQIAMMAWVDRAEVCRAIASLEKRGYLGRRINPLDRRAPIMFLNEAGWAVYDPIMRQRTAFHERIMQSFSTQERDTFDALLRKLATTLGDMSEKDAGDQA